MRQAFREIRRAPARILTSIFALALAVGAIGVLAIPTVSTSSLRAAADADGIPQIVLFTTDTGTNDLSELLRDVPNVDRAEPQVRTGATATDGFEFDVLGVGIGQQQIDIITADQGRLPTGFGEALVTDGTASIGTVLDVELGDGTSTPLEVVGIGGTSFWNDSNLAFTNLDTASMIEGIDGANRIVVRTDDKHADSLRATATDVRAALVDDGIVSKTLPFTLPGGRHPIEADIDQISRLIGLLGIVAGLVALVLLGSTTTTLITERTREVAVMRALGAPNRMMRRRLRRLALGIAGAAVVIGVPLGIAISNFIARLILDEFVGLTPGFAVSVPVMAGSALFALLGARIVAARAARRVTNRPLAEALRDRDGAPFGSRLAERFVVRFPTGNLLDRTAVRNGVHRRARSVAMLAQIAAAVGALMVIASLATTVTDFNAAVTEPVRWESRTFVPGPGLDIDASVADADPESEVGINVGGEVDGWEISVYGFVPDTQMFDTTMQAGRWFENPGEIAIAEGFAERIDVGIGDEVAVELAAGQANYTVVGLHRDRDRSIFVDRDELADDMNQSGLGNVLMSAVQQPATVIDGPTSVELLADIDDDDAGRTAILLIFGAVGAIVVSVAGLAVASGLAVNVFERRHEFAALQAIGARRRHVFRVVLAELLPLGVAGIAVGLVAGYFGAVAIMNSFDASNAIEIGFVYATGAIPAAAGVVLLGSLAIGGLMVRKVTHQPAAVTLRGAA